jgi:RNA polymerase sigma-70 factor (ECF subfamily)
LQKSIQTESLTIFHIEARIATAHSTSPTFESTDWPTILEYYDQLLEMRDTTLVRFNRAVAVRFAEGPEKGLEALDSLNLAENAQIAEYSALSFLSHSIRGDLFDALNRQNEALQEWHLAAESAKTLGEKELARKNMEKILKKVSPK